MRDLTEKARIHVDEDTLAGAGQPVTHVPRQCSSGPKKREGGGTHHDLLHWYLLLRPGKILNVEHIIFFVKRKLQVSFTVDDDPL